ncbi:CDP-diacylglycerol--glycerol-3-phosphate 3-phosphatidyltransferase [Planctomicrobium sp. SH664]|uniref:CDP-diacylglycerol--glycerol-3-phosphate 3-phosphatidyltransferase n=1 Tax=Planctomicrobium sp. SH664 TaxID=3448125 RepID=UPI003F5B1B7C
MKPLEASFISVMTIPAEVKRPPSDASASVARKLTSARSLNIPNLITLLRLLLSFVVLFLIDWGEAWILCTCVFVFAVITDYVDGHLARIWNQVTPLGRILDPFVDKIIVGGTLIFLTQRPESGIGPWVTFTVIGREMFITGLRSVLEGYGVDFSAKWSGKLKMLLQSITIPFCLLSLSPLVQSTLGNQLSIFLGLRTVLVWVMVLITLYSGLEYLWRGWLLLRQGDHDD